MPAAQEKPSVPANGGAYERTTYIQKPARAKAWRQYDATEWGKLDCDKLASR